MTTQQKITFGTRGSALALQQTNDVAQKLQAVFPDVDVEITIFSTRGDKELSKPLPEIGGKGLFTAELESALRDGRIDLAVHSLKDLPTQDAPGLTLGAILRRENPADSLISKHGLLLADLPPNATIGTSSLRRAAQLLAFRPDFNIIPLRGNVDTRLKKALDPAGPYDAIILAAAGLNRMSLTDHVTQYLPPELMLPAPGQGAVAVQCRANDETTLAKLARLEHPPTRWAVMAERAFLAGLGGGCSVPVGALATIAEDRSTLRGVVADPQGDPVIRAEADCLAVDSDSAEMLGQSLAQTMLKQGADAILNRVNPPAPQPLKNKRVLITRTDTQNKPTSDAFAAAGANPIEFSTIQVVPPKDTAPLDKAIADLDNYHWLVLTSPNGVQFFFNQLIAAGKSATDLRHLQIAVVGPATAQAAQSMGIEPAVMPDEFIAEAVVEALGNVSGQRILYPTSNIARQTLEAGLADGGATVDRVTAYQTQPTGNAQQLQTLLPDIDVITFTSSSTVTNFAALLPPNALNAAVGKAVIACIGPKTAATAHQLGLPVHVVAQEYTIPGLIQALETYFL